MSAEESSGGRQEELKVLAASRGTQRFRTAQSLRAERHQRKGPYPFGEAVDGSLDFLKRVDNRSQPSYGAAGPGLLKPLFGQAVFSVGKAEYCWEDVVLAAELWGGWARLRERVREGSSCLKRADDEGMPLSDREIESAADEFRYGRDLVAAEEMEAWLERWGLTAESWMDWIRSSLLRKKWSDSLADLVSEESPSDEDIGARIQTEAVCSGELERLASELAGRSAIYEKEARGKPNGPEGEPDVAAIFEQFPPDLRERGLPGISLEASRAKMERLARLEACYRRFCERAVTPEAVAALIQASQTDWLRLECDSVSFPEEQAAREAALCVREDGEELERVAEDANREVHREEIYIEGTEPDSRHYFLGAQKGETIGPVGRGEQFVLYLVREKVLPSGDDPRIAARAEEAVVQRVVEREVNDRVKWRIQP